MTRPDPQVWQDALASLRANHPEICRQWFNDIEPLNIAGGTMKLLVKEQVQLKYLRRCCVEQFTEAIQDATGRLLAVRFVGEGEVADESAPTSNNGRAPARTPSSREESFAAAEEMLISPDYNFENFVVGPNNELAHAASIAVAGKPGKAYNPLFIYGGVGLGKTHLLQAICQQVMRNNSSATLYYVSCNGFMTQFHESVQAGQMVEFRHRFRNVDLLVIDDIHDLAKRDRTQEEFFHTFNALYQAGRQIVLSSDTSPAEIPDLEERLTSRFNSGLVARIEKPGYETRVEIIKRKSSLRNMSLPEDVAAYVAAKVDTSVRDLEGSIIKIHGYAQVTGAPVDLELAKKAIGEHVSSTHSSQPTIQTVLDTITSYYDVKLTDLLSKKRHKSIALPRQVGMWLARTHTRYSLEEIGGYFGGRDHTTVMHAVKVIESRMQQDISLNQDVSRLEQHLNTSSGNGYS